MANKTLFTTDRGPRIHQTNVHNNAGGQAYALSDKAALVQLAVTGCMNQTFYVSAPDQLKQLMTAAAKVDDMFLAQVAVYARESGYMKDTPALLCALLASRNVAMLEEIFPRVIHNGKMLRNFVQIMRSGVTGRKSLGSAPKRMVKEWLLRASDQQLLKATVGQSPSLADIVKMVHPKPTDPAREAFFAWLIGKPYVTEALPEVLRAFEAWKQDRQGELPKVPFQMLTAEELNTAAWTRIAMTAPWHMTRMNLNTFSRHGVFEVAGMTERISKRLASAEAVKRARVFPYQLLAAYMNAADKVPVAVANALQDAMEHAIRNVPKVGGRVVVCPDVSGSMHGPVTGFRNGSSTKVRCIDVAALVSAAMLRSNPDALVLPFESDVVEGLRLNPKDAVMTNAKKLASLPCGGTNCSAPLRWLNRHKRKVDLVLFVSDNESWIDSPNYGYFGGTKSATMREWNAIKHRSPKAKMVCLDIQPNTHTQATERVDILNIGGFSDQVFTLVADFVSGSAQAGHLVSEIEQIVIETPPTRKVAG